MHLSFPSHLTTSRMCLCECVLKYVWSRNRGGRVYSFPLGSFKKEFRLQSNLHLILLGWLPAYIILHSCSAHMAQRELSLFYYRSDNLGPPSLALVIACPWVFFYGRLPHSINHTTKAPLQHKLEVRVNVNCSLIWYIEIFQKMNMGFRKLDKRKHTEAENSTVDKTR